MVTAKNMSFLSEDEELIMKCNKILKKITKAYGFKWASQLVYYKKYIKNNLKTWC